MFNLVSKKKKICFTVLTNERASTQSIIVLSRGDDLNLTCSSSIKPGVMYVWFFNATNTICTTTNCSDGTPSLNDTISGQYIKKYNVFNKAFICYNIPIEVAERGAVGTNHTLQLYNLTAPDNGGDYVCVSVSNTSVNVSSTTIHFKPTIVNEPLDKDIEVDYQDNVTLTCQAEGFPFPAIQWQKFTNESFEDLDGQGGMVLELTRLALSDSGTYQCFISNVINQTLYTFEVQFNLSGKYISIYSKRDLLYVITSMLFLSKNNHSSIISIYS